jgi:hypothetical protein
MRELTILAPLFRRNALWLAFSRRRLRNTLVYGNNAVDRICRRTRPASRPSRASPVELVSGDLLNGIADVRCVVNARRRRTASGLRAGPPRARLRSGPRRCLRRLRLAASGNGHGRRALLDPSVRPTRGISLGHRRYCIVLDNVVGRTRLRRRSGPPDTGRWFFGVRGPIVG